MKKIFAITAMSMLVLLAFTASAQIQYSNEFWISTNATGIIYPAIGTNGGTLDNPLDGSTETNFDTNLRALPPYSTIHLLAGKFQTDGNGFVRSGQKYIGSGMDVTIVQNIPSAAYGATVFRNWWWNAGINVTNAEISDLTADANYTGSDCDAVSLFGTGNAVRRVRAMNMDATGTDEALGIGLNNYFMTSSEGNIIEECEITNHVNGSATGIGMAGTSGPEQGIIRGNRIFLAHNINDSQSNAIFAINIPFGDKILIEGNYASGATCGVYCDTGATTNLMITENTFENVLQGMTLDTGNGSENNIIIAFNNIGLASTTSYTSCGFDFYNRSTNVLIFGNTIRLMTADPSQAVAIYAKNSMGLVFANNSVDPVITTNQAASLAYFTNNINLSMYNNNDLYGNYVPCLNIPALGGTAVTTLGLDLISSAGISSALTNLGLPSNPTVIVTNNQTGVNLSGTFTGNGSGLASLPDSTQWGYIFTNSPIFSNNIASVGFILQSSTSAAWMQGGVSGNTYWKWGFGNGVGAPLDAYPAADFLYQPQIPGVGPSIGGFGGQGIGFALTTNGSALVFSNLSVGGTYSGNGGGITNISAANISGQLGASNLPFYIRAGTTNIPNNNTSLIVVFASPTPDTNYAIAFGTGTSSLGIWYNNKTTNGFTIVSPGLNQKIYVDYIATKLQ